MKVFVNTIDTLATEYALGDVRARSFTSKASDLDVDFSAPRAIVVTQLLVNCLDGVDAAGLWELPLSKRVLLLVSLSEMTMPPIEVHLDCTCGETAVVEVSARELAAFAAERAEEEPRVGALRLRLPTGRDQLRWTAISTRDDSDLSRQMLADLVVDGTFDDELLPLIDRKLTEVDPLIEFRVDSQCPACGTALAREVDLEAIGLSRLQWTQRALLEDVHVIASAYHWTEDQIARMPVWRRNEYRALLGRPRA